MRRSFIYCLSTLLIVSALASPAIAQTQLSAELQQKIDKIANEVVEKTGTPSVSLAIIKDGQIAYVKAYGNARLEPRLAATPEVRYSLASVGKVFTSAALLVLQEQGKLSIDDKVGKFFPDLTRANEVTIRQLLSMTSGYAEFWPVDYVLPMMNQPVTPRQILDRYAHKPLNFDPGTKWAISDTNFVIAGLIVEKVSGMPLQKFVREKVFTPLGMNSVVDVDSDKLSDSDAAGYVVYGLGPLRIAPKEAKGWLFGGEEFAMTAQDLAKWDVSLIGQKLLKPSSYHDLESDVLLKNGLGTRNALGIAVTWQFGRRALYSIGDVSGYSGANTIFPDDRVAVVVLSNRDAGAPSEIIRTVAPLLLAKPPDPTAPQRTEVARKLFDGLRRGSIDRSLCTDDLNSYFSDEAVKDYAAGFASLGEPQEFNQVDFSPGNGMISRTYKIKFAQKTLTAHTSEMPDGKFEQYIVEVE